MESLKKQWLVLRRKILDFIFFLLSLPYILRRRPSLSESNFQEIKKILALRLDHIGDVILTIPALKALRHRFPQAEITLAVGSWSYEMAKGFSYIDKIIVYDAPWFRYDYKKGFADLLGYLKFLHKLRKENFDIAIDFRLDFLNLIFILYFVRAKYRIGVAYKKRDFMLDKKIIFKENKHYLELNLEVAGLLGAKRNDRSFELSQTNEDKDYIIQLFEQNGIKEEDLIIGISPGVNKYPDTKQWLLDRFAEVADRLIKNYKAKIILIGNLKDKNTTQEIAKLMKDKPIDFTAKTNLGQLICLIKKIHLLITNDTGPMHIAVAVETPLVSIFGPTDAKRSGPFGDPQKYLVLEKKVPCKRPCSIRVCPSHTCMKSITVEDALEAVETLIKRGNLVLVRR